MRLTLSRRWRIAFASAFVHGIHLTVIYIAPSLLLSPERKQLHISLSEATVPLNTYKLCNIICLPFAGLAVDYLGIRRCLLAGLLLGLLGGILYVVSPAVWLYIALSILFALSFMLAGTNVVIVLTSSWFSKSRGLAVGLVLAGYSCAASIAPIVLGYLVKLWKYRIAYMSILLVYSVFVLPVAYKVLEEKKMVKNYVESFPIEQQSQQEEMTALPRQTPSVSPIELSSLSEEQFKLPVNHHIHERQSGLSSIEENTLTFWNWSHLRQVVQETIFSSRFMALAILYFTLQFALGFVYEHFVIFLEEDNHMRYERATVYFAILNTCALLSKVLGGYVADHTCRYRTLLVASAWSWLATLLLFRPSFHVKGPHIWFIHPASSHVQFVVFCVFFGLSLGVIFNSIYAIVPQVLGFSHLAFAQSTLGALNFLGSAMGSTCSGLIHDISHSYLFALFLVSISCFLMWVDSIALYVLYRNGRTWDTVVQGMDEEDNIVIEQSPIMNSRVITEETPVGWSTKDDVTR
ncbi:hypothetical protein GpartN1_g5826.t1 [Galdieria partita]|uniref:Major facilitator superfamily (MFS) profile domain-containing protein n=1 Tax=Galdieria partita TaxID=83374 RepID=A0A9C7UT24_9RHOD|nr:hypothetical protein GpartN1_g5826.t1 [Galdieria partita]